MRMNNVNEREDWMINGHFGSCSAAAAASAKNALITARPSRFLCPPPPPLLRDYAPCLNVFADSRRRTPVRRRVAGNLRACSQLNLFRMAGNYASCGVFAFRPLPFRRRSSLPPSFPQMEIEQSEVFRYLFCGGGGEGG